MSVADEGATETTGGWSGWQIGVAIVAAMVVAQGITLYLMGQPLICKCGYVKFWHGVAVSSENSQHLSDWYTPSHIVHGFLFYLFAWAVMRRASIIWRFALAVFIEAAWEVVENTSWIINYYRGNTVSLNYYGDSIINSVFDTLWMALGFVLAWRLPVLVTIALALALEAIAAYVIRDNLILNVITFIHPFESITAWQTAIGA